MWIKAADGSRLNLEWCETIQVRFDAGQYIVSATTHGGHNVELGVPFDSVDHCDSFMSSLDGLLKCASPKVGAAVKKAKVLPFAKISFDFEAGKFVGITPEQIKTWESAYPGVNISQKIKELEVWQAANKANAKKNYERFFANNLARAQEKSRPGQLPGSAPAEKKQVCTGTDGCKITPTLTIRGHWVCRWHYHCAETQIDKYSYENFKLWWDGRGKSTFPPNSDPMTVFKWTKP